MLVPVKSQFLRRIIDSFVVSETRWHEHRGKRLNPI
jgi:hypothetical protein